MEGLSPHKTPPQFLSISKKCADWITSNGHSESTADIEIDYCNRAVTLMQQSGITLTFNFKKLIPQMHRAISDGLISLESMCPDPSREVCFTLRYTIPWNVYLSPKIKWPPPSLFSKY